MNRLITLTLAAVVLLCLGFAVPRTAAAQTAKDLVGAWTLLSDVNTSPDDPQKEVHLTPGQTPSGCQRWRQFRGVFRAARDRQI